MNDNEFLEMLAKSNDCPADLVRMAETAWQKQVAVEVVLMYKRIDKNSYKLDVMYRILCSVFGLTAIATVIQLINSIILPLL